MVWGQPPPSYFGVQNPVFGEDIGVGDGPSPPVLQVIIQRTAFVAVALQATSSSGAVAGLGGQRAPWPPPSAWKTLLQTDDLPASVLTAGTKIAECAWLPRYPGQDDASLPAAGTTC